MSDDRFERQEMLFGRAGQEAIGRTRVAIIGTGGTGSHVVQQVAFLGSEHFSLIDHDVVTRTSRNRLIGCTSDDVDKRRPKVEVASRLIGSISPKIQVDAFCQSLVSHEAFEAIKFADFVFGCVDRDSVRLILNELCQAYRRPYLDIATDVERDNPTNFGGRLVFSFEGSGCLYCRGELDDEWIQQDFSSTEQRREDDAIYGVPRADLGQTGPSVVSLNGILASLAVTEFMAWVTGLRTPAPHLIYRGIWGNVVRNDEPPSANCYYCRGRRGMGDRADVARYIREGWGHRL